ncbi:MAG: rRNA pseudouridine516 synthase [Petroclostridium sp.]|jgi:16S rRNA pseudouridine516 synthase|uniref:16S rRNA pseudouridine(516) synthase n=1 Tax=Petroclostridium xylanilyticum TaxID=1792311 RepID=UPI000B97FC8A|nr:16S rRNA pseudouridine(516) synthase [Petroclostridium xylanilyticum]MBZ4645309.1 pseudouridine synthase [Clostridia bacterium]MDK2809476.1 rRNA pseudouridine516 synthase [Petroclostridium sp.]
MADTQRLDKVLANSGFGTRKEIKQMVKAGQVVVDGKVVKDSGMHINPDKNEVIVNGKKLEYKQFIYLMMNKPAGVVSATWDNKFKTVVDIVPDEYRYFNIFPVGRLDRDTEGLLLLTNDGQLAHDLLSPRKHVPKTYYAEIEGKVTEEDGMAFAQGVILDDGYKTLPAQLVILKSDKQSQIELTIVEGKFHQVKRMFEAVGKKVKYLKRIKMGFLELDQVLELGQCRELTDEELMQLRKS